MTTLEITIQRKTDAGWPIVVEHSRPGSGSLLPGPGGRINRKGEMDEAAFVFLEGDRPTYVSFTAETQFTTGHFRSQGLEIPV